jgi:hypothetical protein
MKMGEMDIPPVLPWIPGFMKYVFKYALGLSLFATLRMPNQFKYIP